MGLKEMQIMFDNAWATYYTGSKVSGRLILNLDSPKKVREITVKFKGEAQVKWTDRETRKDSEGKDVQHEIDYTAQESYFENKFNLSGETEIPAGTHNFDFSTFLPSNLPSTYEGEYGHIRYTVKVTLNRPWKFDQECKAAFTVICPVDLNFSQESRAPLRIEKQKSVGFCCCKSGPLSATLSAPLTGYTPGQNIPLTVDVENGTNTNVTECSIILRKVVTYTCRSPSASSKVQKTEIAKVVLGQLGAHSSNSWTESIAVPPLPATNTTSCNIIKIVYEVKLKTVVSGMFYKGLNLSAPIIMGTVPLVSVQPPSQPAAAGDNGPAVGWKTDGADGGIYPNLPLPTFEESTFGKAATIQDKDDNEHTIGIGGWVPRYPTFNFTPSAPPAEQTIA